MTFVLNAQINSVKTPAMLKLWGYTGTSDCSLCTHKKCTLHHILVNCPFALDQGRYTWRHDSVLANIEAELQKLVAEMNKRKPVSATETVRQAFLSSLLRSRGDDWSLLIDYDHKQTTFPPNIYPTNQRPDGVLWSRSTRRVVLLELTCCAEEGVAAAQLRKEVRYLELVESIKRLEGRSPHPGSWCSWVDCKRHVQIVC